MSGLNQKKDSIAIYEDDGQLAQKLFGNDNINIEINNNNNNKKNIKIKFFIINNKYYYY